MKIIKLVPMALVALFAFNSCSSDDNAQPVNEEEVITNMVVTLEHPGAGADVILSWMDADGDGPNAPIIIASGPIIRNVAYLGDISLLNMLSNPVDNISAEVLEEGYEHQFFFAAGGGLTGVFAYDDTDVNNLPIGLDFIFTASANAQSGIFTVILRHKPNKTAEGVAAGNIANADGETDIEVAFPVTVQ
jgi:hypothetical protein